jgi:hypothetical protein
VKVTLEEADQPERFSADLAGKAVTGIDIFCADPLPPRYEINFDLPRDLPPGANELRMRLGERSLGSVVLDVTAAS